MDIIGWISALVSKVASQFPPIAFIDAPYTPYIVLGILGLLVIAVLSRIFGFGHDEYNDGYDDGYNDAVDDEMRY